MAIHSVARKGCSCSKGIFALFKIGALDVPRCTCGALCLNDDIETAPGRTRQYPIKDLYKAMAVMRWYKLRPLIDLRAVNPGIWLIGTAALARAHEHPDPSAVEHAREMFTALARAAGILASM
jgi:hypothetical protein